MLLDERLSPPSFVDRLREGLEDVSVVQALVPEVSDNYLDLEETLTVYSQEGVTIFGGGPLDLVEYGVRSSWLIPVEVADDQGMTNFHLILFNCEPRDDFRELPVTINLASETRLKLSDDQDLHTTQLLHTIYNNQGDKQIMIRPSFAGSLAYPLMATPVDIPSANLLRQRIEKVKNVLALEQLDLTEVNLNTEKLNPFEVYAEYEHFILGKEEELKMTGGSLYTYGVVTYEDPWQYYEIITAQPLKTLSRQQPLKTRVDSGCDIGMLYGDKGCDCHSQLMRAVQAIQHEGGMIIHCPTQDGRGYGMNTKMETEAWKRRIPAVLQQDIDVNGTVSVAKAVFKGEKYDLRTYDTVGKILVELGFRQIVVLTDNRMKMSHLSSHDRLWVTRQTTDTLSNPVNESCLNHIQEKHQSELYYQD